MRNAKDIINDINQFEPQDGIWLKLATLLADLWETGDQENFTTDLLKIFERFPEEDGAGVFWSVIHGIETFKSYERELVASLNRQPSEMGIVMLRRIKNSGITTIEGTEINNFVKDLLSNGRATPALKEYLIEF